MCGMNLCRCTATGEFHDTRRRILLDRLIRVKTCLNAAAVRAALCLSCIIAGSSAVMAAPIVIDETMTSKNVSRSLEYLEDGSGALTIGQVMKEDGRLAWKANANDYVNFGYTDSAYWFRIPVSNPRGVHDPVLLEIDFPGLNHIDWYYPDKNGGYASIRTGDALPFATRVISDRAYVFPMPQAPGDTTCYLRVRTTGSFRFRALLHTGHSFITIREWSLSVIWCIYGMLLLAGGFYLFLYLFLRDRAFIHFSFFVMAVFFFQFIRGGFAFQYLWPGSPGWQNMAFPLVTACLGIPPSLFIREVLNTRDTNTLLYYLFGVFGLVVFPALAALSFLLPPNIIIRAINYTLIAIMALFSVTTVYYIRLGNRFARYLLAGIIFVGSAGVLLILVAMNKLPGTLLMEWIIGAAILMLVFFSSLGLADRFRTMHRNLVRSQERLQENNLLLIRTNEKLAAAIDEADTRNEQLARSRVELQATLDDNVALIKELHDRVKNNMQVVSSLLGMQLNTAGNPETAQALTDAIARIHFIAGIHERIYQTENFSKVDMKSYFQDLAQDLADQYARSGGLKEPVRIVSRLCPAFLPVTRAVPCGILIGEIITNAIKHGCGGDRAAAVELTMECAGGTLTLVIADKGPGMQREQLARGSMSTIGMQIIDALSRQVGASIDFEVEQGTRVTVRLPGCDSEA